MNCRKASQLLSAYLDRELDGTDMLQVRDHLSGCANCEAEYEKLRQAKRLLSSMSACRPKAGMEAAIMARAHQEKEFFHLPTRSWIDGFSAVLSVSRTTAIGTALMLMLLATLLWPVSQKASTESSSQDLSGYMAEHSAYQSYQPLAGGASLDLASSDARVKYADCER